MEKDLKQMQFNPEQNTSEIELFPDLSYGDISKQGGYGPCTEPQDKKSEVKQSVNSKTEAGVDGLTEAAVGVASEGINKLTGNQDVKDHNEKTKDEQERPDKEKKGQ
jgi:hypothetical protein